MPSPDSAMPSRSPARDLSTIAVTALLAALIAALFVVGAGPAYRFSVLALHGAFSLITWGAWLGLIATLIALIGIWSARRDANRRNVLIASIAAVMGLLTFGIPFAMLQSAERMPPIHDITTDTTNPPHFVAVIPLRNGAPNSVEYEGQAVAAQQHAAYPDIRPLTLAVAPERAYQRALDVAGQMGWHIDASAPAEGRIEATDTTPWFGFKDDIVVRVMPVAGGSRVDVRSVSRLGTGDLGKNARRIRAFLHKLAA